MQYFFSILPPDFNPHSHEGSDDAVYTVDGCICISIHTPTKGVTRLNELFCKFIRISIHTPTKGVTAEAMASKKTAGISIHTPTKGVTTTFDINNAIKGDFNPHSHEGSDDFRNSKTSCTVISIHTPTKGVTRQRMDTYMMHKFQSTLPRRE